MSIFTRGAHQEVEIGQTYHYIREDTSVEDATVVGVVEDLQGIRHVRYDLKVRQAARVYDYGQRILGLSLFAQRFKQYTATVH